MDLGFVFAVSAQLFGLFRRLRPTGILAFEACSSSAPLVGLFPARSDPVDLGFGFAVSAQLFGLFRRLRPIGILVFGLATSAQLVALCCWPGFRNLSLRLGYLSSVCRAGSKPLEL